MKLIVGLGNPGSKYRRTRHNVGFEILLAFAQMHKVVFQESSRGLGGLAQGSLENQEFALLMPATFMNESGQAVKRYVSELRVPLDELLVVCDDVALPLGKTRIRLKGSAGGHNGLKSIQAYLGTEHYARLRIGIGDSKGEDLADYVLDRFLPEEQEIMEGTIKKAVAILTLYVTQGIAAAMQFKNEENIDHG